jgi:hypothetical protein
MLVEALFNLTIATLQLALLLTKPFSLILRNLSAVFKAKQCFTRVHSEHKNWKKMHHDSLEFAPVFLQLSLLLAKHFQSLEHCSKSCVENTQIGRK